MKSTLNILVLFALLAFTLSCGVLERLQNPDGSGTAETEQPQNTDESTISQQDGFETEDFEDEDDPESALESDDKEFKRNRSFKVRFGKGRTSRSYKNVVAKGFKHVYTFSAQEGQRVSGRVSSGDGRARIKVFDFIGKRIYRNDGGDKSFTDIVPETGSYKIEVITSAEKSSYTVTFSASALPKKEDPEPPVSGGGVTRTVKFSKGRSSASYRGAIVRGDRDTYVLGAKAGQQMTVSVSSVEANAVIQIRGPRGYLRGVGPGTSRRFWSGQLPANGKYRVTVSGTRGNATYTVNFAIR